MNDIMEFLTSKEIIVVYIVAFVACVLCFIIYLVDKTYAKRKRRQNTKELNRLVEQVNNELQEENVTLVQQASPEVIEQTTPVTYVEPVVITPPTPIMEETKEQAIPMENTSSPMPTIQEEVVTEEKAVASEPEIIAPVVEINQQPQEKIEQSTVEEMIPNSTQDSSIPKVETTEPIEEITYTDIEPKPSEAQEALLKLTQELEKAEEETKNITLTSYEEEQEKEAIISLEELMQRSKEIVANNEMTQYAEEGNAPISLEEFEKTMKQAEEVATEEPMMIESRVIEPVPMIIETNEVTEPMPEKLVLEDFNQVKIEEEKRPVYQEHKKFQSSPIISPIYGIEQQEKKTTDIELENTANYEKLDEEIKKTNEFLSTLRELQKHLD